MIDCAIGPGAEYSEVCTLEWLGDELDSEFLIHHPDGSFRRFAFDGEHQIVTTDGADPAETIRAISHAFWEFSVGGDRYKLPLPDGYGE
ncbi:hypothetical protein [uncultured Erythrobacter sp.]|uniref:hypothetical protein n=1 Tax=uncultured Erythrobacter sp. TaxID=263913 RepID=UPI002605A756|nr:hypothetical protein [uncultured Erythrobacter sp.]